MDFVLIDGWPVSQGPSLARQVIEIVAPQIRIGGYVMNDNGEPDFLDFVRNPSSGFLSGKGFSHRSRTKRCPRVWSFKPGPGGSGIRREIFTSPRLIRSPAR